MINLTGAQLFYSNPNHLHLVFLPNIEAQTDLSGPVSPSVPTAILNSKTQTPARQVLTISHTRFTSVGSKQSNGQD